MRRDFGHWLIQGKTLRRSPKFIHDPHLSKVWAATADDKRVSGFFQDEGLLWFKGSDGRQRLCVPRVAEKDVYHDYHILLQHIGFDRAYHQIRESFYIKGLAKRLKEYIARCPTCLTHQTLRGGGPGSRDKASATRLVVPAR